MKHFILILLITLSTNCAKIEAMSVVNMMMGVLPVAAQKQKLNNIKKEMPKWELPVNGDFQDEEIILTPGAAGEWDHVLYGAFSPCNVIKIKNKYYLYYIGASGIRKDGGPAYRALGVAISDNGINKFKKYEHNPIKTFTSTNWGQDEEGIFTAVPMLDSNKIKIFYTATKYESTIKNRDGSENIAVSAAGYVMESNNGINFGTETKIIDPYSNPHLWGRGDELAPIGVLKKDGIWYLYYIAKSGTNDSRNGGIKWDLGVAWGSTLEDLTAYGHSKQILEANIESEYVIGGTGQPIMFSPDRMAIFVNRSFENRTVEVRYISKYDPREFGEAEEYYNFSNNLTATFFLDEINKRYLVYYLHYKIHPDKCSTENKLECTSAMDIRVLKAPVNVSPYPIATY